MMAKTVKKTETEPVKAPAAVAETKPGKSAKAPKAEKTAKTAKEPKAPKTTRTKAAKTKVFVEYQGRQLELEGILEAVRAAAGQGVKTLEVYVKPEDGAAYYVSDGGSTGKVSF